MNKDDKAAKMALENCPLDFIREPESDEDTDI